MNTPKNWITKTDEGLANAYILGYPAAQLVLGFGLILGIYFRVKTYLMDMPLWPDTARLAVNLVERSYSGLFLELYGDQSAPVGFLAVAKLLGSFFNYSESSLYFLTLAFSLATLALFLILCLQVLGRNLAIIGFLPFALSPSAIFYAGTFKQYSAELFFCVLLLIVAHQIVRHGFSVLRTLTYGLIGIVSPWFSLSAIILISGSAIVLCYLAIRNRQQHNLTLVIIVGAIVFLHFMALYLYQIRPSMPELMENYWSFAFPPKPLWSIESMEWWLEKVVGYPKHPGGFVGPGVYISLIALACASIYMTMNSSMRPMLWVYSLPVLITVALCFAEKYPIPTGNGAHKARLALFTVPMTYLLVSIGVSRVSKFFFTPNIFLCLVCLFLFVPQLYKGISSPIKRIHDMPSVIQYLNEHYEDGDVIYVDVQSAYAFRYYNRLYNLPYINGTTTKSSSWYKDMEKVMATNKRIWIAISVGQGSRMRMYHQRFEERYAPVTVQKYKRAWLLLSDPSKRE